MIIVARVFLFFPSTARHIVPTLVIYDPELTFNLPPQMTASTGINALAHCIEALYSKTRNPLSTAAATSCYAHGAVRESIAIIGAHPSSHPQARAHNYRSGKQREYPIPSLGGGLTPAVG